MYTLLLNTETWDLTLDEAGNIATATNEYAIAQNAANAVRLFTNDAYFNLSRGIPHYLIELGQDAHLSIVVLSTRIKKTVMSLNGVKTAQVELFIENNRVMGGKIFINGNIRIEI